jgi:hypothetical protein
MEDFRSISPLCGALRNLLLILSVVVVAGLRPLAAQTAQTVSSNREEPCLDAQRLEKAERGMEIKGLMWQPHIPGMSIAVIHDFHVVCAKVMERLQRVEAPR